MKWRGAVLSGLVAFIALANAAAAGAEQRVAAQGARDGSAPGWSISTVAPAGWTTDCCTYAKAIGVDFVIYKGEWTGEPERVMVLNVWPRKLPTLAAEWQADQNHYLQQDPQAVVGTFALDRPPMPCHGLLYRGSDHIDDIVVFCDPGKASGIRFSWSMTVKADDPLRQQLGSLLQRVVEHSLYAEDRQTSPATPQAVRH